MLWTVKGYGWLEWLGESWAQGSRCQALKPTSRAWQSFQTSSLEAESRNDTNIRIVTWNLPITKFLSRVVGQNSKISKYQL